MKFSGAKAEAIAERPPPRVAAFLIYGPDRGLSEDLADRLAGRLADAGDPFATTRLTEDDLRRDEAALVNAMLGRSLLGGRGVVRLRLENEQLSQRIQKALNALPAMTADAASAVNPLLLEAGDLRKTSKLRQFFEEAEPFAALQLFEPSAEDFAQFVVAEARTRGFAFADDALMLFLARTPFDRNLARAELEKLSLYWSGEAGPLPRAAAAELAPLQGGEEFDEALAAAFAGAPAEALEKGALSLDAGLSPVFMARAAARRTLRLLETRERLNAGQSLEQAIAALRPPLFFRARPAFERELRLWPFESLSALAPALYRLEAAMKAKNAPQAALMADMMLQIARSAEARARRG